MLAIISPLIARGVIDNAARDLIDLRLWCSDGLEPLHFRMAGNCLRDIAGCRVEFTNKTAAAIGKETPDILADLRQGRYRISAGDITLSRRAIEKDNRGNVCNMLSIELFANEEIRILIESADFDFSISLPQWEQTQEGDMLQQVLNMEALRGHVMVNVRKYRGAGMIDLGQGMPPCQWDYVLNRAEAYMAIYPSIHEKYGFEPGGYLSAAFVLNRTDFLNQAAAEDEADLPPDMDSINRDWEVLDFLEKKQAEAVREAMRHPLFNASARMTAAMQKYIIDNEERNVSRKDAANFVNLYASIVTHLLATILLTMDKGFSTELAATRIRILARKLNTLNGFYETLPEPNRSVLKMESAELSGQMKNFLISLSR